MLAFAIRVLHDEVKRTGLVSHMSAAQALEALRLLQRTRPQRRDDFNKWLVDAWVREEEPLAVQGFRLLDPYGREWTFGGPAESEAREIGVELDRAGGLHAMEAIREAIEVGLGDAAADKLTLSWQGVGPWPAAETPDEIEDKEEEEAQAPCVEVAPAPTPAAPAPEIRPRAAVPGPSQAGPSNGLAIASLVVGIVSLPSTCCYGFGGPLGIVWLVLGFLARRQIRDSGAAQQGDGLAIAGMITGGIAILGGALWVVLRALGLVLGGQ